MNNPKLAELKDRTAQKLAITISELQFEPIGTPLRFGLEITRGVLEDVMEDIKELDGTLIKELVMKDRWELLNG